MTDLHGVSGVGWPIPRVLEVHDRRYPIVVLIYLAMSTSHIEVCGYLSSLQTYAAVCNSDLISSSLMEHAALSAPVEMESEEILSRIILVVSVASMIGSGWIIISFLVSMKTVYLPFCSVCDTNQFVPSLRTFRHQLILGAVLHPDNAIWLPLMSSGLGISEFLAAGNVVISASLNTLGIEIWDPSLKAFCSFNGLMVQTFVVQGKDQ